MERLAGEPAAIEQPSPVALPASGNGFAAQDRSTLLDRLEARRQSLRVAAQTPSRAEDALARVSQYTRDYPWAVLAGAFFGGAVLGRFARRGGLPLMLSLAMPLIRRHVVPKVVAGIVSSRDRSDSGEQASTGS